MRSLFIMAALMICGGCNLSMPHVHEGMTRQQIEAELKPQSIRYTVWREQKKPDGSVIRTYRQQFQAAICYIIVTEKDGVATDVQYQGF